MLEKLTMRPGFGRRFKRAMKKSLGIAMLEVILAIGVVGIIIGGVIILFVSAQERQKRTDTVTLINQIRAGVESTFATSGNYTGLNMELLYDRGKVPDTATTDGGTTFNHPFGNLIQVSPIATGGKRFWVALRGLDEDACEDILGTYIGMTRSRSGIVTARVHAATPNPALAAQTGALGSSGSAVSATMPYNLTQVGAACAAGDGEHNVYFLFG